MPSNAPSTALSRPTDSPRRVRSAPGVTGAPSSAHPIRKGVNTVSRLIRGLLAVRIDERRIEQHREAVWREAGMPMPIF